MPTSQVPDRVYARLMAKVERDEAGCLISGYSTGSHGYSQIGWSEGGVSVTMLGHRAVWIHERGPISDGMTIDHRQGLCSRRCIEISHLREIPNLQNAQRNQGTDFPLGAICRRGHAAADLVWMKRAGGRMSQTCGRCRAIAKENYVRANPEKRRATVNASNARRRGKLTG